MHEREVSALLEAGRAASRVDRLYDVISVKVSLNHRNKDANETQARYKTKGKSITCTFNTMSSMSWGWDPLALLMLL